MSTNNKSIQILRGDKSSLSDDLKKTKLEPGQPFFDKNAKTLQIGDGSGIIGDGIKVNDATLATAPYVTVKDGAINDAKVASDAAIKGSKLADASNNPDAPTGITTEKIENGAITTAKLDTQYFVKNATVSFVAPVRVPLDKGIQWSQQINPNQPWSSLFLKSAPIKSLNTKKTLILPYTDGTLATKEQIENGEIIAQTSQNATNATYAQKTDFSNAEWITHESNTDKVSVNYGESYEIIGYNGRFDDDYAINDFAPTVITIPPASMWNETRGQGFILGSTISSLMSDPDIIRVEESTILIDRDLKMSYRTYLKKYDTTTHRWVGHEWISQNGKFSYRRIR